MISNSVEQHIRHHVHPVVLDLQLDLNTISCKKNIAISNSVEQHILHQVHPVDLDLQFDLNTLSCKKTLQFLIALSSIFGTMFIRSFWIFSLI